MSKNQACAATVRTANAVRVGDDPVALHQIGRDTVATTLRVQGTLLCFRVDPGWPVSAIDYTMVRHFVRTVRGFSETETTEVHLQRVSENQACAATLRTANAAEMTIRGRNGAPQRHTFLLGGENVMGLDLLAKLGASDDLSRYVKSDGSDDRDAAIARAILHGSTIRATERKVETRHVGQTDPGDPLRREARASPAFSQR